MWLIGPLSQHQHHSCLFCFFLIWMFKVRSIPIYYISSSSTAFDLWLPSSWCSHRKFSHPLEIRKFICSPASVHQKEYLMDFFFDEKLILPLELIDMNCKEICEKRTKNYNKTLFDSIIMKPSNTHTHTHRTQRILLGSASPLNRSQYKAVALW